MRYLAIDYGMKRTGLAVCDPAETMAFPYDVLQGRRDLIRQIGRVVASENIDALVLGLPLNMDGSEGSQAKVVRSFAGELKAGLRVPVFFQDERLSSFGAQEKLEEIGLRKGRKRQRLDALAAAEILQAFLERKRGEPGAGTAHPPEGDDLSP
ncbi:MAG: Holliday junction resolvase RuvX [Planctomycetes bacterium]|jgi:putative Holliday junction resolvase|nr:Holliday junction resolvase RuvX [Planctomycetota bacterium]